MRIEKVELIRLTYRYSPDQAWGWPGGTYRGWTAAFVRVTDDEGCYGIGEIGDGLPAPQLLPPIIERVRQMLVGKDPRCVRGLLDRLYRSAPGWGRRGIHISVLSGVESALFDLLGKRLGVPVHVLLGGAVRTRLPVYASGGVDSSLDQLVRELRSYVERGFTAVKVRIGYGYARDIAIVEAARHAVGKDVRLLLDFGASYLPCPPNLVDVARLARELEKFDPYWLEEPLFPDDVSGHRRLRQMTHIPIALGENTRTHHEVLPFLEQGAVDILQTDAVYAGGMLEQLRIASLAAQYGVMMAPHTWGSAPGLMANLHAFACMPNGLIAEYSQMHNPLRERLLLAPLQLEHGELVLPEHAGLGIDLPESLVSDYPYDPDAGAVLKIESE
ncbi:mandelate racemase/muconate lactonizing enzyme family protein [Geochorda subterranea]|uniref:Mandelate racemase/muconate lactonizing enzyme family protein n=1 Tax=Geochorda subterranea TaxID=3109564 RepID=A0ABZ1BLM9_9FIRM|nr:mandelate racemase/muconate lactonizing enzyme family protein [Limnochorda sp. LNt]WRP13654.1 mandelate racemase/muconate lactonizing enzyme family protein [Limnochorda sp. LNt]